ncbi:MAG: carboxypeptidase-like regulatory domain-containing protein [Bacteroidia bacterium]|nr:carboxypeptidase-like regulatory domain-containing protein [Bacteroidia bacterium]
MRSSSTLFSLFITLFVLLAIPATSLSQVISGQILDQSNSSPIPYVNIGVLHRQKGTVSDEHGEFRLELAGFIDGDSIRISSIGYAPKTMLVKNFLDICEDRCQVKLIPTELTLEEVVIVPKKYRDKIVGNDNAPDFMQAGFEKNDLGYEMGVKMSTKRVAYLQEVYLDIAFSSYDSIFYRLNVYRITDGKPGQNILKKPIYLSYSKEDIGKTLTIDIRDQYVRVEGDFLISLELVKDFGEGKLMLKCGFMNNQTWYRKTSQGDWTKMPIGVGISALIKQEKEE